MCCITINSNHKGTPPRTGVCNLQLFGTCTVALKNKLDMFLITKPIRKGGNMIKQLFFFSCRQTSFCSGGGKSGSELKKMLTLAPKGKKLTQYNIFILLADRLAGDNAFCLERKQIKFVNEQRGL